MTRGVTFAGFRVRSCRFWGARRREGTRERWQCHEGTPEHCSGSALRADTQHGVGVVTFFPSDPEVPDPDADTRTMILDTGMETSYARLEREVIGA